MKCDELKAPSQSGGILMEDNTCKFEIKIDPIDMYIGLKDQMAEFESLIRMENPGKKLAEKVEKDLKSRFCHCCFFGHVKGELMGEPLCEECAKILYGFDENEEHPSIKKIDPYYLLWYRRRKALPIFEAYLHAELERYKLELKLEDTKASSYTESVDAGMENRRLKRALWLARAATARNMRTYEALDNYTRNHTSRKSRWNYISSQRYDCWFYAWDNVEQKCLKKAEEYK